MSELTELIEEKPWVREYLYFNPDFKKEGPVFEEELSKFKLFISAMEETREHSQKILSNLNLPDYKEIIELLAVFKVMTHSGVISVQQRDSFFDILSAFIKIEKSRGRTLDDIFEDRDAIALSRLYQVTDKNWAEKYITWILYELGAISKEKGTDVFGSNASAFQTYDFLKQASDGNWRPQKYHSDN
jgi:hypothetical protein